MVGTIAISLGSPAKTYNRTKGLPKQTFIQSNKPAKTSTHGSVTLKRRHYSTINSDNTTPASSSANLNPYFISGFVDAEVTFLALIAKSSSTTVG